MNKKTQQLYVKAFTEWERRAREEPDLFASDSERLAETPESYGEAVAPYFLQILAELKAQG